MPETGKYRDAITRGLGDITWIEPGQSEFVQDDRAQEITGAAIKSEGTKLAAVNYVSLALDPFKEVTGQLKLTSDDFQTGDLELEAIGRSNEAKRYLLYSYTGKELPKHPDRPLVYRWVQTYALYDNSTLAVIRVVATIRGEVHE